MVLLLSTPRGRRAARLLLLLLLCIASIGITCAANEQQHPDLLGLLALKASICADSCKELSSWNASSNPCTWEGVYCGYLLGEWRAVSINLQLDAKSVLLNDSALSQEGGDVLQLPHVRELELLCMKSDRPIGKCSLLCRLQTSLFCISMYQHSCSAVESASYVCGRFAAFVNTLQCTAAQTMISKRVMLKLVTPHLASNAERMEADVIGQCVSAGVRNCHKAWWCAHPVLTLFKFSIEMHMSRCCHLLCLFRTHP
jgi:hypothetical protein